MKEVYIINYFSSAAAYGIGTYIHEYIECLKTTGCKVNLVILENTIGQVLVKHEDGIRKIIIPYLNFQKVDKYNKAVYRLLRLYIEDSPDLIFHYHYTYSGSLVDGIKKYFPQAKNIITIHYLNWSSKLNGNIILFKEIVAKRGQKEIKEKYEDVLKEYFKEKELLEKMDAVICLSVDTLQLVTNEYAIEKSKLHLIYNGLKESRSLNILSGKKEEIRKKYYIANHEKILLFVGRINPIKGIFPLLSSFNKVVSQYPDCRLIIVGDGDTSNALLHCGEACAKVTFTGRLAQNVLYQWYQVANIAVFPSFYEECSFVGIEMMMHGLPVVASDGYGVAGMFHQNALMAGIGDMDNLENYEEQLKDHILHLLGSDNLCLELSKKSKRIFHEIYESGKMEAGYRKILLSL